MKNGASIDVIDDVYEYQFDPHNKQGVYRIVASLNLAGEWMVWALSNPIYIH